MIIAFYILIVLMQLFFWCTAAKKYAASTIKTAYTINIYMFCYKPIHVLILSERLFTIRANGIGINTQHNKYCQKTYGQSKNCLDAIWHKYNSSVYPPPGM